MKTIKQKFLIVLVLIFLGINVFAQITPPGGGCTNCPPFTNSYTLQPYIPGLKLSITQLSGTNHSLNLLEADPAGKYDIYFASNLVSSSWSDILQGTNSQTNFTLIFPQTDMGFFKAARTDTPITNAANVNVSFANLFVNTNLIMASVIGGPAAAMAVLVNDTNFTAARWIPFSSVPLVLLGTNDGTYNVWFGFQGSDGTDYWSMVTVTLDSTSPSLVITNPTANVTSKPMIQLKGYCPEPLTSLTFTITNSQCTNMLREGLITEQYFDTNLFELTTNWFECLDIGLTQGTNFVSLRATDRAGNVTVTNLVYIFNTAGDTNAPVITLVWPQDRMQIGGTNFTLRGLLDDETASLMAQIVNTNGTTNVFSGLVERDGKFWAENLPLSSGTNFVTISATDFSGNTSTTNLTLIQSPVSITIDPVPGDQLYQLETIVTGTVSDPSYGVSVNGVAATVDGSGNWTATNAPVDSGTTACFDVTASSAGQPSSNQSATTNKPPYVYVQSYNLNYHSQITGYTVIRLTKVDEIISLNWENNKGGSGEYDYVEILDFRAPTPLVAKQSTVWPSDGWTPTLNGTRTTVTTGLGQTFTSNTIAGPPSIAWESCNTQGTSYYNYADEFIYPAPFTRSAQTTVRYFTGGKSLSSRENLHQLNVGVNQQIFEPGFEGGSVSSGEAITNGVTAGVFGTISNGVAYKLLPDGIDVDITASVASSKNYNFGESAIKIFPVILSLNISGTNLSIGDNLNFPSSIYGVPPQNLLGKVTPNSPPGCQGYFGKVELIGQVNVHVPPTTFVIGQTRDYYIAITFNDGSPPQIDQGSVTEDPMNYQQGTPNVDYRIFAIDGPGLAVGVNPTNIASIFERQNFTTYVKVNGNKCSNDLEWHNQTTIGSGVSTPIDVGGGHVNLH